MPIFENVKNQKKPVNPQIYGLYISFDNDNVESGRVAPLNSWIPYLQMQFAAFCKVRRLQMKKSIQVNLMDFYHWQSQSNYEWCGVGESRTPVQTSN